MTPWTRGEGFRGDLDPSRENAAIGGFNVGILRENCELSRARRRHWCRGRSRRLRCSHSKPRVRSMLDGRADRLVWLGHFHTTALSLSYQALMRELWRGSIGKLDRAGPRTVGTSIPPPKPG